MLRVGLVTHIFHKMDEKSKEVPTIVTERKEESPKEN